jgi:hypothetical protein
MTVNNDAAAAAAARRAAELAARKAAELAAKKAAEAAAKKAAELAAKRAASNAEKTAANAAAKKAAKALADKSAADISRRAGQKPSASAVRQAFGKDELSKGLGRALRERSMNALGGPAPSAPPPAGRTTSLNELRAMQAKGFAGSPDAIERNQASKVAKTFAGSPDALERAQASKAAPFFGSPDALERAQASKAQPFGFPAAGAACTSTTPAAIDATQAAQSTTPTPEARAAQGAVDVQGAWDAAHAAGKSDAEAANAASQKLRELTKGNPDIAYNNALIRASAPTLDKISTVLGTNASDKGFTGDTDKAAVKDSIRALSDVATASGEIGSFLIADQIAQKLPNSDELMHVDDGFYDHADNGGQMQLMGALASRLEAYGKNDAKDKLLNRNQGFSLGGLWDATGGKLVGAAENVVGGIVGAVGDAAGAVVHAAGDVLTVVGKAGEMAVDVAKGTVELAGDAAKFTADQVSAAAEYAAKNGLKLAGAALNWVGDHARELAAKALDIDGQLAQLNSPGDSVTMAVGGKIGATVLQGGADVEMKITKTKDGYEMTLTGKLSGGVFGGLSLPGFPSGEAEANATGIASATMKFTDLKSVTTAAETVGGIGIATAIGGPAGALLTGATAGDEIQDITNHFESGSVGLELSAEAKAKLGDAAGLGAGGEISGAVTTGARIEITKGQPPALVLEQSIEAKGKLALGLPVEIPSLGGKLNGGSLDGSATISAETRIPLPDGFGIGDLASDPVGAMKKVGQNAIDNSTTKLSIGVDVHEGVATQDLPINFGANGGLDVELSGEAKTKDLVGALAKALHGDLSGALNDLGTKTNLDVHVNSYTTSDLINIDEEVKVPGFTIGVHAQDSIRDETEVWSFEGTPAELAQQGFNLFKSLQLNVS